MGFIRHALIGIALYEVAKYYLKKEDLAFGHVTNGVEAGSVTRQRLRNGNVDIIAGARQPDHLNQMRNNAAANEAPVINATGINNETPLVSQHAGDDLDAGTNPDTPLTGREKSQQEHEDPWKNSLANDELRAPDS
jgi:hypothetical protein